ncbi:MAG: class I SAM-dependent methyltransferase [Candidatus Rokubacteria bacterium]|nr:class I SAM-dependent methyltransferase [Candidatus Rokubacteria bacterium]
MTTAKDAYEDYYAAVEARDFFLPRYRWTIDTLLPGLVDKQVLEIGCGDGGCIQLLKDRNAVVGVDASESGVRECEARALPAFLADVSTDPLPFDARTFDIVICLETFEHLANPQHAVDEIKRVLRRDGVLVCSIPNPRTGHPYLYPGLFTFGNFRLFLEQNGFVITRTVPWGWAPPESILPRWMRRSRLARSRYVAGFVRGTLHCVLGRSRFFPYYLYWLWTFAAVKVSGGDARNMLAFQAAATKPGTPSC